MYEWDDLRYFAMTVKMGSFAAAARALHVDTATVGRKIARLETSFKGTLFIRSRKGLKLTSLGRTISLAVEDVESAINNVETAAVSDTMGGSLRIAVPEAFGAKILVPKLPEFHAQYPELRIEVVTNHGALSSATREVDIAISFSAPTDVRLQVESLTSYELAAFVSPEYAKRLGEPKTISELKNATWIGYVDETVLSPEERYMNGVLPSVTPQLASSSILMQRSMVETSGGIGILPIFLGDGLVRILENQIDIKRNLWISTHKDVFDLLRMRVARRWLSDAVESSKDKLETNKT